MLKYQIILGTKIVENKKSLNERFVYLDNIRSLVIVLVLAMHAAVTYSGFGAWFYVEGSTEYLSIFETVFFGFFQSFLQAWTMGALFFISAYFASRALVKRGALNFIKERLFRLGIPLIIFVFIVTPFILFILLGYNSDNNLIQNYLQYLITFIWLGGTGPLWYVQTLLIFSIVYAIVKKCLTKKIAVQKITPVNIVFIMIVTGIVAFLLRIVFPIGSSFFNLQLGYFSSYIVMFIMGVIIGENDLLNIITDEKNIKWLKISLVIGIPFWALTMLFGGALDGKTYYNGGFNVVSLAFSFWESLTAIGFSIGIIALFRKKVNIDNKFTGIIRDNAFGLYFFHAPIMVIISLILKNWFLKPLLKFLVVLIITFFVNLLFSYFLRKIKPMGLIFR